MRGNSCVITSKVFMVMAIACFAISLTLSTTVLAAGKTITLNLSHYTIPKSKTSQNWLIPMCKAIEERTNGKVKITIHWAGSLSKGNETFDAIVNGLADMGQIACSYNPGRFLACEIGNLPYAVKDVRNLNKAFDYLQSKGYFDPELGEAEVLAWQCIPPYSMLLRKHKPMKYEDLAGIKARSAGGYHTEFYKAIGMVPVRVLPTDYYSGYEKGLYEAFTHRPMTAVTYKLYEIPSKSWLELSYAAYHNIAFCMNKEKLQSMSPDLAKIIRDTVAEYSPKYLETYLKEDEKAFKILKEKGVDVYTWPETEMAKLRAAAVPIWKKFIADCEKKKLPAKKMMKDFVAYLQNLGEKPAYVP